jgi:hypothetical protein
MEFSGAFPTMDQVRLVDDLIMCFVSMYQVDAHSLATHIVTSLSYFHSPLENQAYSNNPFGTKKDPSTKQTGRANPILPRSIQDRLEAIGWIDTAHTYNNNDNNRTEPLLRSSQRIDLTKTLIRNVVTFRVPSLSISDSNNINQKPITTVVLTVFIQFWPDKTDMRKINVKFESFRVRILPKPTGLLSLSTLSDFTIPLGVIGPTGWLRTTYLDDNLRITRGFKGSVFVLTRPAISMMVGKKTTVE